MIPGDAFFVAGLFAKSSTGETNEVGIFANISRLVNKCAGELDVADLVNIVPNRIGCSAVKSYRRDNAVNDIRPFGQFLVGVRHNAAFGSNEIEIDGEFSDMVGNAIIDNDRHGVSVVALFTVFVVFIIVFNLAFDFFIREAFHSTQASVSLIKSVAKGFGKQENFFFKFEFKGLRLHRIFAVFIMKNHGNASNDFNRGIFRELGNFIPEQFELNFARARGEQMHTITGVALAILLVANAVIEGVVKTGLTFDRIITTAAAMS